MLPVKWTPRIQRGPVIALSMVLVVAILAFRFAIEDPSEPITFLMVIPIGLLAAEMGLRGGLIGRAWRPRW